MEKDGYDIVEACNSRQCLEICQEKQTDIVLLDAVMPGIDSFTCCEQLQRILGEDCPPNSNYYKSKRSRLGRYRF